MHQILFRENVTIQQSSVSEPHFGALRGNVCDSSLARRKADSRFPVGDNWTFFTSSDGRGMTSDDQISFVRENCEVALLSHCLGDFGARALPMVGKLVMDFL